MALINCPECGREISDKALSCPGCGCPASEFKAADEPQDTRSEVEKVADEIFWEKPSDSWKNAKILAKRTGIPFTEACGIMNTRYAEWRKRKKRGEYSDTQYCPVCGSSNIEDEYILISSMGSMDKYGSIGLSETVCMKKCNMCRNKWKPKHKKCK
nr:MAG TPA: hydrogenase/urease nickel incorporation protein [Bacteriophage sp.]